MPQAADPDHANPIGRLDVVLHDGIENRDAPAEERSGEPGVERVRHFSKGIEQEAPYVLDDELRSLDTPRGRWPFAGRVSFKNVSARYRPELPAS